MDSRAKFGISDIPNLSEKIRIQRGSDIFVTPYFKNQIPLTIPPILIKNS
jgi:hypothetical protein